MSDRVMIQRFEVRGIIGAGAIGVVYRAYDPQLEREVAIKVIARHAPVPSALSSLRTLDLRADRAQVSDELLTEARVMARLSHANILSVYEVGIDHEGSVFLVSELVDGGDLRSWCATPRPNREIFDVFEQVARGLAAAHAAGVVHRDLKPDNILIGRDGRVRIADFGLSRLVATRGEMVRIAGDAGTPSYMAPEVWRSEPSTPRSDVYAFGVTLIEALLGTRDIDGALAARLKTRNVVPTIAAAIIACVADDPRVRPTAPKLVGVFQNRSPRPRAWPLAIVIALGGAGGAVWWTMHDDAPPCSVEEAQWPGRWGPERKAALEQHLRAAPDAAVDEVARVVAMIDEDALAIARGRDAACVAGSRGEATTRLVEARLGCLDRRAFMLAAVVSRALATKPPRVGAVGEWVSALSNVAGCAGVTAAPVREPVALAALYERFVAAQDQPPKQRAITFREVEEAAEREGDVELRARAMNARAPIFTKDPKLASELLEQSYRLATEIGAIDVAATSLLERGSIAQRTNDATTGASLDEASRVLAEHPTTSIAIQIRVALELARVALRRSEWGVALDHATRGRQAIAASKRPFPTLELSLRRAQLGAMAALDQPTVELAEETVALARKTFGDAHLEHAQTLDILSKALQRAGRIDEARVTRARIVDVFATLSLPPENPGLINMRAQVATDMLLDGSEIAVAHRELVAVLAVIDANPALQGQKLRVLQARGIAEQMLGRFDDANRTLEDVIELALAQGGPDHAYTLDARRILVELALQLGRIDQAKRHLALVRTSEERQPARQKPEEVIRTRILASELARQLGQATEAESEVRQAIASAAEQKARASLSSLAHEQLGVVLVSQRRWREALAELDEAASLARRDGDVVGVARSDLYWAKAAWQLGRQAEARERVRTARPIVDGHVEERRARVLLEELDTLERRVPHRR